MQRRQLLATAGLAVGTAGCLAADDGEDASSTTTEPDTSTPTVETTTTSTTATPTATVDVAEATLQQALVFLETDYLTTTGGDGRYLLVDVAVSEGRLDRREFALRVDDQEYRPDDGRVRRLWRVYQSDNAFEADVGGLLLFELPRSGFDATADAAVTWPDGEHRLDAALCERLRADAPALSVSVDAPDTVARGDQPTFDVAVTNDGDVPVRFVAGLNRYGSRVVSTPEKRFSMLVDAGATVSTTYAGDVSGYRVPDADLGDGQNDLRYAWNGAAHDATYPIEYVAADA